MAKVLSNIEFSILSCEILSFINMLSIFCYLFRHRKTLSKSSTYFLYSTALLCFGLLCDIFNYIFDGMVSILPVLYVTNYLAIIFADLIGITFILYIYSVACISDSKISKVYPNITFIICALDIIFQTYGAITQKTFFFENAIVKFSNLFVVYYIAQILTTIVGIVFIVINKKALKLHYSISFTIYYIVPLIAFAACYINSSYMYMYISIAISFLIVYVEIESRKERILISRIKYDPLTNLLNRAAYNERIKELSKSNDVRNVGVIFCDINGLKYVNDHQGHKAGDEYIMNFANILVTNFRETGVFRLSGDEFIVILQSINKNEFEARANAFANILKDNNDIASCGSAYGSVEDINKLVDDAEKTMYENKTQYHLQHNGK